MNSLIEKGEIPFEPSRTKISLRYEGGLGDVLLSNRLVPAIKDKWGWDCSIDVFLDTENNPMQENALRLFYPHFYNNIETIKTKRYSKFVIDTQFGEDVGFGGLENVPEDIVKRMTTEYDIFLDMHIDGLKWIDYDFNWKRYFSTFPEPDIKFSDRYSFLPEKYVILHLASNNLNSSHRCDDWYCNKLIKKISERIHCVILCTDTTEPFLRKCLKGINEERYYLLSPPLEETAFLMSRAELFLGIDSGLCYLSYGMNVPTLIYSAHCHSPQQVLPSHYIRWLVKPECCLPKNYDLNYVSNLIHRICERSVYSILPYITDFDSQCINRKYKVNLEKSILK